MPIRSDHHRPCQQARPALSRQRLRAVWPGLALGLALLAVIRPALALNPQDRDAVGQAFVAADQGDFGRAFRLVEAVDDPLPALTLRWLRMLEPREPNDFATIAHFLLSHPDWPWPEELQIVAEGRITDPADHDLIREFFQDRAPLTTRGTIRYAEALFRIDQDEAAKALIRRAWVQGDFSPGEEQKFFEKYRRLLTTQDNIDRLDNLLWDYRRRSANRMLGRVPEDQRKLAIARMRLQRHEPGIDRTVEAVPAALRDDQGLDFDRLRWRRQKQRDGDVVAMLLNPPDELVRPERWWFERELQIRRALRARDFDLAYQLASRHGQSAGDEFVEAEWLAGWLALRFERQPNTALRHFERLYAGTAAPGDRARAAYWAGRSAAVLGDQALATAWYQRAAKHQIAYYGQLAAEELGTADPPAPAPVADAALRASFEAKELVRVARMLIEVGATDDLLPFLIRLADLAASPAEVGLIGELAAASGRPDLVGQVGRLAAYYGQVNEAAAFPIPDIERLVRPPAGEPEPALLLGIARQESVFNTWGASDQGAQGVLQLMPHTASLMARSLGLHYNRGLLTGNPDYNIRLGSYYLKTLLDRYGEPALAIAAYNAGPRRVDEWLRLHGDPRRGDRHALVDWIELIPFAETRNYVQRVLEGRNMYRWRLNEPEVATVWFRPINGPLDPVPAPTLKPRDQAPEAMLATSAAQAPGPAPKAGDLPVVVPAGFGSPPTPQLKPLHGIGHAARASRQARLPATKPAPDS
ncbi:MAG TPA: transglycosylase SLT domain-containing protein [Geminicoccaceae bacterium]|nr:transglycosylase SLT domain-containing protein [Geminicoccaceae bacterium]